MSYPGGSTTTECALIRRLPVFDGTTCTLVTRLRFIAIHQAAPQALDGAALSPPNGSAALTSQVRS